MLEAAQAKIFASEMAIKVLEAARLQNAFIPVLEALFANQTAWASHGAPAAERIMEIAGTAGLDTDAAADQIRSPSIVGILNQDRADVEAIGVQQTPTFFVNGKALPKFGAEQLKALVENEISSLAGE